MPILIDLDALAQAESNETNLASVASFAEKI